MQVIEVGLEVVQLECNLFPTQEGEVAYLKEGLILHVVDISYHFSDTPEMTDEQLAQKQPSHLRNPANYRQIKKKISIYIDKEIGRRERLTILQ